MQEEEKGRDGMEIEDDDRLPGDVSGFIHDAGKRVFGKLEIDWRQVEIWALNAARGEPFAGHESD